MVTLRNLYTVFGHDPKWRKLATRCLQPMITIYLRKLGDKDITTITDFDLQMAVAMSQQPQDVKVPAQSCMNHLRNWANEQGKPFAEPEPESKKQSKPKPAVKKKSKKTKTCSQRAKHTKGKPGPKITGTIYHDSSSAGLANGKRVFKDCYRAEITISGQRYRHRSKEREDCESWLRAVKQGKIKPTDNKADWWRMEQRKDDAVRIDEIIHNQAEESLMLLEYHQSGNITDICDYMEKRLLPHMMYYAAHTLHLGKDSTITAARQAAGLLLTRITAGKPVMNFTATCKRMLRIYKQRGDFFYYEKAPEQVQLMVNGINFDALADIWRVTKDRRI